jgi:predicted transcriptional regulator
MILKARQDLGIQQKALALEMGISDAYMHELESGSRKWKLKLFNRAKAALERLQPKT